jgi:hypothetical protein
MFDYSSSECVSTEIQVKFDYKKDAILTCTNESSVNVTFYFKMYEGNRTQIQIDSNKYLLNKSSNTLIIKELRMFNLYSFSL